VLVASDNPWQQRARLLQSLWRERKGLEPGPRSSVDPSPLGSRLTLRDGEPGPDGLHNYMSPAAKDAVLAALADPASGAMLSRPRLWVDLLSSQPLCFNVFGPLAADTHLASAVFSALYPGRVDGVRRIAFEYSPGRDDPLYTDNRSAFDVFVEYDGPRGPGFLGIEVKYHENLVVKAARDKGYAELAAGTAAFRPDALRRLAAPPLQQLWLDHLLALRMRAAHPGTWADCVFVLLHPAGNRPVARAATDYASCLSDASTFESLTLERLIQTLRQIQSQRWVEDLYERYLDPRRLAAAGLPDLSR
jgi:hypothetical protein